MTAPFLPAEFSPVAADGAPLISIVTASYNSASTIRATLESVAAQSERNFEHIIVDGASSDETLAIAEGYDARVVSARDGGIYQAFNKGLALARGELINFLNSDDVYAHSEVTTLIREAAERWPEADLYHGDLDIVDEAGELVERRRFRARSTQPYDLADYRGMKNRPQLGHPPTFVRRSLFARLGGFDTRYRLAADYEFFLRAFKAGAKIRHVPSRMVVMRDGGASRQQRGLCEWEVLQAVVRQAGPSPVRAARAVLDFGQWHGRRYARNRLRSLMRRLR